MQVCVQAHDVEEGASRPQAGARYAALHFRSNSLARHCLLFVSQDRKASLVSRKSKSRWKFMYLRKLLLFRFWYRLGLRRVSERVLKSMTSLGLPRGPASHQQERRRM